MNIIRMNKYLDFSQQINEPEYIILNSNQKYE